MTCLRWLLAVVLVFGSSAGSKPEIERLFLDDQADRNFGGKLTGSAEHWKQVVERDRARRARVRQLIDEGALRTGVDYEQASYIFQHGSESDDYLLAHVLAMTAVAKGNPRGRWIAAATLDRYLHSMRRPQVFGTQYFRKSAKARWSQAPYDRKLLPDSLRTESCVPAIAQQEAMLAHMDRDEEPPVPAVCK